MDKLVEYYQTPHFKLHFKPEYYIHHQAYNGIWRKDKWENIVKYPCGIKRIQYNTQKIRKYIIVDIDNDTLFNYENLNIPKPNFIVKNKNDVGGHLFWVLDYAVSHQYYLSIWNLIQKEFTDILNGDKKNIGFIGKNLHDTLNFEYIEVNPYSYNINDLYKYIINNKSNNLEQLSSTERTSKACKKKYKKCDKTNKYNNVKVFSSNNMKKNVNNNFEKINPNSLTRNCDLFDISRKYIYKQIKYGLNKDKFTKVLQDKVLKVNSIFEKPLDVNELTKIQKSITKYCFKKWDNIKNYKIKNIYLKFDDNVPLKDRQIAGAKYTNEIRVQKTIFKIKEAIKIMNEDNLNINVSSIAKRINMTNVTVRKYKYLILENHEKIKLYFHNKKELENITIYGKKVLLNIIKFGKVINKVHVEKVDSTVSYHYIYNPTKTLLNKLNLMIKRVT